MARLIYSAIMSLEGQSPASLDFARIWQAAGAGAHVRQRHRLPPLSPGVGRLLYVDD